jgi:phosphoribosylglycinamide formyltransferase-1
MISVVFLVSGGGGTLKFLNESMKLGYVPNVEIKSVISDRVCGAYEYAQKEKLPARLITYTRQNNEELRAILKELSPDIIVTTFYKILDPLLVQEFENKLVNLHYSLLPAFKALIGMKTIDEAIKLNSRFIGGTLHLVDAEVDNGKIVSQFVLPLKYPVNTHEVQNIEFRASCFLFLNYLCTMGKDDDTGPSKGNINIISNAVYFEPEIVFDTDAMDENFWNKISS